jgi:hypothetical protein
MEQKPDAHPNTDFSLKTGGHRPGSWLERSRSITKPCAFCGKAFGPNRWISIHGVERVLKERAWDRQPCCGQSCAKKLKNPMSKHATRMKVRARLREIKHKPIKRGGNGCLLPLPQLALLHALGEGWESEVAIPTKMPRESGYPTAYKVDIGNSATKIAIEVDGGSHQTSTRREQDAKKTEHLIGLGWLVCRVSNEEALRLYSTFMSKDTLLTSLMGGLSITAT